MKAYLKVSTFEELPKKDGDYIVIYKDIATNCKYDVINNLRKMTMIPEYWLKEIDILEDYIRKTIN